MGDASRDQPLRDRIVLVTGAAEGLGRAVALGAATRGATLVLCDRRQLDLEPLYDAIESAGGAEPAILPLDLESTDPDAWLDTRRRGVEYSMDSDKPGMLIRKRLMAILQAHGEEEVHRGLPGVTIRLVPQEG